MALRTLVDRIAAAVRTRVHRNPTLYYGVPFVLTIVGASFGLTPFTQTRYVQHDAHVRRMSREEALELQTTRRPLDLREEYFRLQSRADELDDWEPVRVARPPGVAEWGGVPKAEAEESAERSDAPPPVAHRPPVVLGRDGRPCRACNTKVAFAQALRRTGGAAAAAGTAAATATGPATDPCPPDVAELGHSTWTFLHSAAAYYPDEPSATERDAMHALLRALPHVYPCAACAAELQAEYARRGAGDTAAAVVSGAALREWLCVLHNSVNERLGKPVWDCGDVARLDARWREPPAERGCDDGIAMEDAK